jgi:hypothetical protein
MEVLALVDKAVAAEAEAEASAAEIALKGFHANGGKTLEHIEDELDLD